MCLCETTECLRDVFYRDFFNVATDLGRGLFQLYEMFYMAITFQTGYSTNQNDNPKSGLSSIKVTSRIFDKACNKSHLPDTLLF